MAKYTIVCPDCRERIRLRRPFPDGTRMSCPACGREWISAGEEEAEDAFADDLREPPRRPSQKRKKTNRTLFFAVLAGVGVVFVLAAVGIIALAVRQLRPSLAVQTEDYAEARKHFHTRLLHQGPAPQPHPMEPPPPQTQVLPYTSGPHRLTAWISPPPGNGGGRQPAVLFLHGGFALGEDDWDELQPYLDAGFVVMTPALRGENGQPGHFSLFYDEVDDVLAAADELARQPHVDKERIYVAGHSAGGTLTLLAALTSKRFRAAASFSGSPDQVTFTHGDPELTPFDKSDPREYQMRSPVAYARSFKCPTRLYYGDAEFFFKGSSHKTAQRAREAALDVAAEGVPGDHFTSLPEGVRRSVLFFKGK